MSVGASEASSSAVLARLEAIAVEQLGYVPPLLPSASLADEVALDSMAKLTLVMGIEEAFAICLADDEAARLERVADAVALVQQKLAAKGG